MTSMPSPAVLSLSVLKVLILIPRPVGSVTVMSEVLTRKLLAEREGRGRGKIGGDGDGERTGGGGVRLGLCL